MKRKEDLKELLIYMLFGLLTTVVNWGTYCILEYFHVDLNVCNVVSWFAAVIFTFFTNKFFVFKPTGKGIWREFCLFFGARTLTGVLELGLFPVFLHLETRPLFGIAGFMPKISVCMIAVVLNYFCSKWIIFK